GRVARAGPGAIRPRRLAASGSAGDLGRGGAMLGGHPLGALLRDRGPVRACHLGGAGVQRRAGERPRVARAVGRLGRPGGGQPIRRDKVVPRGVEMASDRRGGPGGRDRPVAVQDAPAEINRQTSTFCIIPWLLALFHAASINPTSSTGTATSIGGLPVANVSTTFFSSSR